MARRAIPAQPIEFLCCPGPRLIWLEPNHARTGLDRHDPLARYRCTRVRLGFQNCDANLCQQPLWLDVWQAIAAMAGCMTSSALAIVIVCMGEIVRCHHGIPLQNHNPSSYFPNPTTNPTLPIEPSSSRQATTGVAGRELYWRCHCWAIYKLP